MLAAAAAALFTACDFGASPGGIDRLNFDAAVVAADGASEDLQMMHGPGLGLPGIVFPPLDGNRPDCPTEGRRFHCPPIEREGLTFTRTITYFDANGESQEEYDEASTALIHYEISVQGDLSRQMWSATINRHRDLTVTELLDDDGLVKWNGTASGNVQRSRHMDGGAARSYSMVTSAEISDVVIPYPRTEEGWPVSGTIVRTISVSRISDGQVVDSKDVVATITFNGTQFVPVTVGDETFTIDLAQRRMGPGGIHGGGGPRGRQR
jgi:hypothetical protein